MVKKRHLFQKPILYPLLMEEWLHWYAQKIVKRCGLPCELCEENVFEGISFNNAHIASFQQRQNTSTHGEQVNKACPTSHCDTFNDMGRMTCGLLCASHIEELPDVSYHCRNMQLYW